MYKIVIDRGETYLFFDRGTDEIDYKKDIMGFFINTENIIDLIKNIPISKYYVKDLDGSNKIVTEDQAIWLYHQIIDFNNKKNNKNQYKKSKKSLN